MKLCLALSVANSLVAATNRKLIFAGMEVTDAVILLFKVVRYPMPRELPPGQCTLSAARAREVGWSLKFKHQFGRGARLWGDLIRNGKLVQEPEVGSILVLGAWGANPYGPVAYVGEVQDPEHSPVTHLSMRIGTKVREYRGGPGSASRC